MTEKKIKIGQDLVNDNKRVGVEDMPLPKYSQKVPLNKLKKTL